MDIIYLSIDLAFLGVFFRGAIARGGLYHNDNMCFGPALIGAYELESKNAIYPSVILDNKLIQEAINIEANSDLSGNTKEDAKKYYNLVTKIDNDGFRYIDFMSHPGEFDDGDPYIRMLEKIYETVNKNVNNSDSSIKQKYLWLKNKISSLLSSKRLMIPLVDDSLSKEYWNRINLLGRRLDK